jgi:hypothetical protein
MDPGEYHKIRVAHLYEGATFRFKSAADYAQLGLRSVLIANGGALAAVVAYLGTKPNVGDLSGVVVSFTLGLFFALCAVLAAYVCQSFYGQMEQAGAERIYFHQIGQPAQGNEQERDEAHGRARGGAAEWVAVILFMAAVICFLLGAIIGAFVISITR